MADAPQQDEAPDRCGNPFDSKTSDRIPFPSFDAALANNQPTDEAEHQDTGSALDWSIDTLAELKPVTFSPLPQQKDGANSAETPRGTSSFFEDEKQYEVLRTPLLARATRDANRNRTPRTSSSPMELHRRCRDTIARCESALRERQHKMDKLQTVLPPPTSKSPRQRLIQQRATPPSRSTPPRPAKRHRLSTAVTPNSEWLSPNMRPPKWSASPIAVVGKRPFCATPVMLHFDAMTPLSNISRSTTPKQSSKVRLSFGLSPISFPSPRHAQEEEKEEENSEEKPNAPSNEDTLPLGSSEESAASVSKKENRDNRDQQAHSEGERQHEDSSSSHGTSSPTMRTPTAKKPARSLIPQRRQQAFMEAMKSEACSSSKRSPQVTTASSILSLYQEAKRLGMTDPHAQWQCVQSLRQRRQKQKLKQ